MKPLAGITILEFSTMITASFAAMMMAEQGARVIKVEPIEMGDPMRYIGTSKGGISALFANSNRGKESIRVDLKQEDGQQLIQRLAKEADVLIHNFRPGVMDKLNLGSATLRASNDQLVYVAISGFGKEGPLGNAPAYDPIIQAHAGLTATQGKTEPEFIRNLMCDKITAYTACQATTAALYAREKNGQGQHIDLSMLDAGLFFVFPDGFMNHTLLDDDISREPRLADLIYDLVNTSDGRITISAATENQRAGVIRALDREDLFNDDRFSTLEKLLENMAAYQEELSVSFLNFRTDDILDRLREHHVPAARCHDYEEVLSQPQIVANETVEVQEHPLMGSMRLVRSPAQFEGRRLASASFSPAHGQDTEKVLREIGLSESEIDEKKKKGVVL